MTRTMTACSTVNSIFNDKSINGSSIFFVFTSAINTKFTSPLFLWGTKRSAYFDEHIVTLSMSLRVGYQRRAATVCR
ncbi:hypothetical protein J6590_033619 [Homalodisca vitripennis]|nr:hypothetical protein J6590_033619 [Homalodisca vitripennis]